jgi:hypothetical protein
MVMTARKLRELLLALLLAERKGYTDVRLRKIGNGPFEIRLVYKGLMVEITTRGYLNTLKDKAKRDEWLNKIHKVIQERTDKIDQHVSSGAPSFNFAHA